MRKAQPTDFAKGDYRNRDGDVATDYRRALHAGSLSHGAGKSSGRRRAFGLAPVADALH